MATKVVYKQREEKKEFQKQFGCMNGLFQLFDRRYLLGLHRNGRNQKMLTPGEGENGKKEIKNSSEKVEEINTKRVVIEKSRVSIESSRNSFSSSCSSTTFSSLECSKRVHMEMQIPSLSTSPKLRKNQQDCSLPDIRDVVKNSMTRTIRVASAKNIEKEMKHIDSPRPFVRQKSVEFEYERKDRNLAKEASRLSCDERESKYSLKSSLKVKEVPRLSLDSKQNKNSKNTLDQTQEPGSNKRPSSGVVARLMGLEGFQDSNLEIETLKKTKIPFLDHELVSRFKKMEVKNGSFSVYGEMEKRLSGIEFKTSGKDLRALKQILEGIKNKEQSLETKKKVKPVNGTRRELVNREVKPVKLTLTKVNHGENGNDSFGRKKVKDLTPRKKKVAGGPPRLVACSNSEKLTGERKKSKKVSSDLTRVKKQSNSKNPKTKMKNKEETRNDQPKEDHKVIEDNFVERLIEEETQTPIVDLPKITIEQPSPVSVLDVFYTEDTPSPLNKKDTAFNDYEALDFEENQETEWNQVEDYSDDFKLNFFNSTNEEHEYISEILLTSGFLKDIESAIRIVQIHPTGSLIKPDLFHFLEKKEGFTDDECHKKNEKLKRKLIFDSVNDILLKKLVILGSFDMWSGKRRLGILNGEKLLKELCSEIDNLQTAPERFVYDEDDEVKNLVSVDVNKSEDWGECCYEVPGVVLDIERLIFKDLIDEVVNADMAPRRQCRRLFPM
ncbi:protein LONGIFOLIA 1 isoform X1 [Lactuca sativa]|uniref:DUF4378 domain-containing protein n=1 Tax=Lactuca sativa TaxID=4236 RepID=A0A9R1XG70_LACSA|nr:protein LONGIFOLIA 1 isoform X1 [Lactuca sativa]KAJ0213430.1 hypothetical protein LSAT_V11C400222970 [Lactuca sativa]